MRVKPQHPLAEVLAKKLFGITMISPKEQEKAVSRAVKAAVEWHEEEKNKLENIVYEIINEFIHTPEDRMVAEKWYKRKKELLKR